MIDDYYTEIKDTKYCYPNSSVLINKLNITDQKAFESAERDIVGFNLLDIRYMNPVAGNFDFQHLKDIHKRLFGDIYTWAGQSRTVNIGRTMPFAPWMFLDDYGKEIFQKLEREKYLMETPQEDFGKRIAFYFGEVNALHPFREGNGRTQKVFFEYLAAVSGHRLIFKRVVKAEMDQSSAASLAGNNQPLEELFRNIIEPESEKMQRVWIRKILSKQTK